MITTGKNEVFSAGGRGLALAASAALALGVFLHNPALAQDNGTVTVDVERCLALESEAERRECFAAQVDEVIAERGSAVPTDESPGPVADEAGEAPRSVETGRSAEASVRQQQRGRPAGETSAAERPPESDADEYFGTITDLRERLPNAFIITLDNGQIWEQTEPKRYPLRPGLEVRIYTTRWGNRYRLTGLDSGGHIQVRRLQ